MSASKQKKLRQQERQEHPELAAKRKQPEGMSKKKKILITVIVLVLAAALIAGIFTAVYFTSGSAARSTPAAKVGEYELTAAEYSYFYSSSYQNYVSQYGDYLTYLGLDTKLPLADQKCTMAGEGEDITWAEYFQRYADSTIQQTYALYDGAVKDGFTLSEEDQNNIDTTIKTVAANASSAKMGVDDYYNAMFGGGVNEEVFRKMLTVETTASAYARKMQLAYEFTDAQLEATYQENKDTFDIVTYRTFLFNYANYLPKEVDTTSASTEQTNEAKAQAKKLAEEFLSKLAPDAANFNDLCAEYAPDDASKLVFENNDAFSLYKDEYFSRMSDAKQKEWLSDSARKKNESAVVDTTTGNYYVTTFIERGKPMDKTVNIRHILAAPTTDIDAEKGLSDEQLAEVSSLADQYLKEWKNGAATEESFAELAARYSADTESKANGGLYEKVYKGEMPADFNAWCFDSARKTGDTDIVRSESGAHVLYFIGHDEVYWKVRAKDQLTSDTFAEYLNGKSKDLKVEHLSGFNMIANW